MKIIFIPNLPYTYRDHQRFGVEYFLKRGYDVEVMDVHHILLPGYKEKVNIDYWTFDKHYEPQNIDEVVAHVQALNENDFIFFYIAGKDAVCLLNTLKANTSAKFMTYVGGSIPVSTVFCRYTSKLKNILVRIAKILIPKYKDTPFETDFFISGSPKDEKIFPYLIGKNTKLIQSNSRDYDLCLTTVGYEYKKPYCVFLDTDVIDASDYVIFGDDPAKDAQVYLDKILEFFKWIEEKFAIDVIIAAHPKSRLFYGKDTINGIKIVHQKSAELVKNSQFVLTEGTTAISYAVFFRKPIIFFTFELIHFFYDHCCSFAKELDKKIVNIDHLGGEEEKIIQNELLNTKGYDYYKKTYLTYSDSAVSTFETIDFMLNEYNHGR